MKKMNFKLVQKYSPNKTVRGYSATIHTARKAARRSEQKTA